MVNAGFFLPWWQPLRLGFMKGKPSIAILKDLKRYLGRKISSGLNKDFGTVIECQLNGSEQNKSGLEIQESGT